MWANAYTNIKSFSEYVAVRYEAAYWKEQYQILHAKLQSISIPKSDSLYLKDHSMKQRIAYADIIMLKAESNYTIFYLQNGQCITTSKTLKLWIELIQQDCTCFQRVHRSYFIHTHHIQRYLPTEKYVLLTGGHKIQVARRQKFKFSL